MGSNLLKFLEKRSQNARSNEIILNPPDALNISFFFRFTFKKISFENTG